jgi:AGCS family alanine or glycine:cation symporter
MDWLTQLFKALNDIVWGVPMIVLILGTGFYLQIRLGFMPLRNIVRGFRMIWRSRRPGDKADGDITPYAALMTALSATVGTGNIAGVATAIAVGGPGALFWMWMTALLGMATKYGEVVLAVKYREKNDHGQWVGGPMYAIKNGLGSKWKWLGTLFAIFGGLAGFGIGSMVQSNGIASAMHTAFGLESWITAWAWPCLPAPWCWGHHPHRRGGRKAGACHVRGLCDLRALCAGRVLRPHSGCVCTDLRAGLQPHGGHGRLSGLDGADGHPHGRGARHFSNEAGLGTAGIAQAAGATRDPVFSGLVGMMGTFIDTIIVCTMTGLAIVVSGVWNSGATGAVLSTQSFEAAMPGVGKYVLAVSLSVFAFTTILGWAYYGEKCWTYLVGTICEKPFRILWTISAFVGAVATLDFAWLVADTLNALMAIPNLISLLLLSPVIVQLTREYFARQDNQA